MAAIRALFGFINALIPFTDPSRAVWRDILHSVVLCTFLYFAPQLQLHRHWQSLLAAATGRRPATEHGNHEQEALLPAEGGPGEEAQQDDEAAAEQGIEEHARRFLDAGEPADREAPFAIPQDMHEEEFNRFLAAGDLPGRQNGAPVAGQNRAQAGAANPPVRLRDPNRAVGAKKAKSLARKERQRAYNEFLREQGDMQRAQEASTAEEREKELAEERARRQKVEADIKEQERKKREEKRERENKARREEIEKVHLTVKLISEALERKGMVELARVVEEVGRDASWVEAMIKKEGILGLKVEDEKKTFTMLTGMGWIVRVDQDSMKELYKLAAGHKGSSSGKIGWSELGILLEQILTSNGRIGLDGG